MNNLEKMPERSDSGLTDEELARRTELRKLQMGERPMSSVEIYELAQLNKRSEARRSAPLTETEEAEYLTLSKKENKTSETRNRFAELQRRKDNNSTSPYNKVRRKAA